MRVAIVGSRQTGCTEQFLYLKIREYLPVSCSEIVSGGAAGVDRVAQKIAQELQIGYTCFTPDYNCYGKAAPLKRNQKIIDYSDMIIAFWNFSSKGTQNSIINAIESGKPVRIIDL